MPVFRIEDPDDPRLEPYRAVRERDLVGRQGLFVVEGRVVLEKAARAIPEALESVLIAEPRLTGLADVLAALPQATPVYAATQAAMDRVVGFPIHRGVLAIARSPQRTAEDVIASLPPQALVVGLVGIANHDNMGGIFRNAAAFGADAVLLDETCCDPLYRKAIRVSVGGCLAIPFARAGDADRLLDLLDAADFSTAGLSPTAGATLDDLPLAPRTAVLLGAEGPGLPASILARVRTAGIAMSGGFDSLNVATTSGIVLHHLARRRNFPSKAGLNTFGSHLQEGGAVRQAPPWGRP